MILAIDQGQTKTIALAADETGAILGIGHAPGASAYYHGVEVACSRAKEASENALKEAGKTLSDVTCICGGMTGANWKDEFEALENEFKKSFGIDNVIVYNDSVIALRAGDDNENSFILCNGSGLNCVASVNREIKLVYNNYVEPVDQGSEGLCARALIAVINAYLGFGEETVLTDRVKDYFEIDEMDKLMLAYYRGTLPKPMKGVARIVIQASNEGDKVADTILREFGESIARYPIGAVKMFGIDPANFVLVLSGGLFKNQNPIVLNAVEKTVHNAYPSVRIAQSYFEPVLGALLLALDKLVGANSPSHEKCKQDATERGLVRY